MIVDETFNREVADVVAKFAQGEQTETFVTVLENGTTAEPETVVLDFIEVNKATGEIVEENIVVVADTKSHPHVVAVIPAEEVLEAVVIAEEAVAEVVSVIAEVVAATEATATVTVGEKKPRHENKRGDRPPPKRDADGNIIPRENRPRKERDTTKVEGQASTEQAPRPPREPRQPRVPKTDPIADGWNIVKKGPTAGEKLNKPHHKEGGQERKPFNPENKRREPRTTDENE